MKTIVRKLMIAGILVPLLYSSSFGYEMTSRYATLTYTDAKQLVEFNNKALRHGSYRVTGIALSNEVKRNLDLLINKVTMILLQSKPREQLRFRIILVTSAADIQRTYMKKYWKRVDYVAFYSPRDDTIFISLRDLSPVVLAHELAHVIIHHYFHRPISVAIHERLAESVERHIDD